MKTGFKETYSIPALIPHSSPFHLWAGRRCLLKWLHHF